MNEQEKDIDKDDSESGRQSDTETNHEKGSGDQDRETPEESVALDADFKWV